MPSTCWLALKTTSIDQRRANVITSRDTHALRVPDRMGRRIPHPPFGHLLPAGEKGTVIAFARGSAVAKEASGRPRPDGERVGVRGLPVRASKPKGLRINSSTVGPPRFTLVAWRRPTDTAGGDTCASACALIILILVIGVWLGWLARAAHVQRDAVAAIEQTGAVVRYDWQFQNGIPDPSQPWAPK
jgi:hypothetical protein